MSHNKPTSAALLQLISASLAVTAAALGLWRYGFKRYALPLSRPCSEFKTTASGQELDQLAIAFSRTARLLPWSSCLTRSCALAKALRRRGMSAQLHIGVARPASGMRAHAWVELEGQPIGNDGSRAGEHSSLQLKETGHG